MGKLVVTEFVSLDGVFEDPGGSEGSEHAAWTFAFDRGHEGNQFKLEELMNADAQLFGRVTYEGFAAAWPSRDDEQGFAKKINSTPKYVVSTTLASADWEPSTIIRENVAEEVRRLKTEYVGDILVAGSGTLARYLLGEGLIDQLNLMVFPLVLGSGKRLFAEGTAKTRLSHVKTHPVGPDGVTVSIYQRFEADQRD